jgi:SAM-dependent methyltransferase
MPACAQCIRLVDGRCSAWPEAKTRFEREVNPAGACVIPIVDGYLAQIQPGMRVLEIGCGTWDAIRQRCLDVGAHYEGIDSQETYYGKKTIATRIENLRDLSFPDQSFDLVIGNQTMEHWAEFGCPIPWGLFQCFRACAPGGRVLLNVPIHFHGTRAFLLGDFETIRSYFRPFSSSVRLETWREPCAPLPPFLPHPAYPLLRSKPAYVLAIEAVADKRPVRPRRSLARLPVQVLRTMSYPLSFNIYRAVRRIQGVLRQV